MRTLAINSIKGGVGKTTITINLGAALAATGQRVLIVDTDPQGHVALSFGLQHSTGFWDLMIAGLEPKRVIYPVSDHIDVIPSDRRTAAIEQQLVSIRDRATVLMRRLESVDGYDFVLVDTAPFLSLVLQNAIVYCRGMLIPISMNYLALWGAVQALELARMIQDELKVYYDTMGIVPNLVDSQQSITHPVLEHLDSTFRKTGIEVFSPIRKDNTLEMALARQKTILDYAPGSAAAADFVQLATELVSTNVGSF